MKQRSNWLSGLLHAEEMYATGYVYKGSYVDRTPHKLKSHWVRWKTPAAEGYVHSVPTLSVDFINGVEAYLDQLGRLRMIKEHPEYLYVPE